LLGRILLIRIRIIPLLRRFLLQGRGLLRRYDGNYNKQRQSQ